MNLYDRIMRATESDTASLKATQAATGAARIASEIGHPGLAAAAGVAAALIVGADTVLHAPKAAPSTYADFND